MKTLDFNGIKMKWLGHDAFKFNFDNKVMYIDPYEIRENEKADIILITHGHYDHCSVKDLQKIVKQDTMIITTPDTTSKLAKIEGGHVKLVKPRDHFSYNGMEIKAVAAYNVNKEFHPKANEWVGYIFTINNVTFYHAGDTDYIPEIEEVTADVALLPVSGTYVMDVDQAVRAVKKIMPKIAIPMHYGKIVGSKKDAEEFKEKCTFCQVKILD